jgi:5'-3' exonuclease
MGNDFLPHHYGLEIRDEAIDLVIDKYSKVRNSLKTTLTYENGNINIQFLKIFIKSLADIENTLVMKRMEKHVYRQAIRHGHSKEDRYKFYPDYHREIEKEIGFGGVHWDKRYYNILSKHVTPSGISNTTELNKFINQMCNFYIQGLVWNMKYYLSGCISTSWYYPYLHAPTFQSLYNRLCDLNQEKLDICVPKDEKKYTAFEQLILVLPPQSVNLLPQKWRSIMNDKALWPERFQLDPIGSIFRWQCAPILHWKSDSSFLNKTIGRKLSQTEKKRLVQNYDYFLKKT